MATGSDLIAKIASRQNLVDYQKKHWSGSFADYLDIVRHDPRVTRTAYQRVYDMILSQQGEGGPVPVLRGPRPSGPGRHLRPREDAVEPGQRPQERGAPVRDRASRVAAPWPGRQLQEHDRAAAQEGAGALLADRRGGAVHVRLARGDARRGRGLRRLPDARGAAPPDPGRVSRHHARGPERQHRPRPPELPGDHRGGPLPLLPPDVQRADGTLRGGLGEGPRRHPGPPPDPLGTGPDRGRHVPAQG